MDTYERKKRNSISISTAVLVAVQTGLFAGVWFGAYRETGADHFVRGNPVLCGLYTLTCFQFHRFFGTQYRMHMGERICVHLLTAMLVNGVTYVQLCLICRWRFGTHMLPLILLTAVQSGTGSVWSAAAYGFLRKRYVPRQALLIYGKDRPNGLLKKFSREWEDYRIVDAVCGSMDPTDLRGRIRGAETVVLADIPTAQRNDILQYCFAWDIRCFCVQELPDVMVRSAEAVHLTDTSLLLFRNMGLTPGQKRRKRMLDLTAAVLLGIPAIPVMALIALCIRLSDGGPVFFTQQRLTEGGKAFRLYKFRSMRISDTSGSYVLTRKQDERVTSVGKVIRKFHLDELPQILNILKGEMSFVGPRPECPDLAREYSRILPQFSCRLKVKAGLTGYAQVYGRYNTTPGDKLLLDLHYMENYSFWLDLKLMLLTGRILFRRGNTEGIEPWQTSAATEQGGTEAEL